MLKIFVMAFAGSIIFTWAAIRIARLLGVMDKPAERKIHKSPMPLLGGVAVFAAFATALFLNFHFSPALKGIVVASFALMLTGLADDIVGVSAKIRLLVQIACSIVVVSAGVRLNVIPSHAPFENLIEGTLTVIWIMTVTNAVNFIDGADGLASGISVIAALAFFAIAIQTGQVYFALLNMALVGACLGFLVFNFHPARIFLGDAGSSFLGFCLASLAVMGEWSSTRPIVAFSIPLLILAVPIFDIIYISVARVAQGQVTNFKEWIEYVGKDHLHHRLAALGFSHTQTVVFIYLISIVFALGALVLKKATTAQSVMLVSQGIIILVIISVLMIVGKENLDKSRLGQK